jgi:hypothetical protein
MITKIPKILTANKRKLTETFDYVHNVMSVPHHIIVKFPQVMHSKLFLGAALALLLGLPSRHSVQCSCGKITAAGHNATSPKEIQCFVCVPIVSAYS